MNVESVVGMSEKPILEIINIMIILLLCIKGSSFALVRTYCEIDKDDLVETVNETHMFLLCCL